MGSAFYYSVWITSAPPKKDAPYWRAPSLGSNQVQAVTKLGFVAIRWLVLATPGVREKKQMISKEKIKVWKRRCSLQPHVDSPMPLPTTRVRVWGGYCSYTALWCPGSLSRDHHKAQPCASQTLEVLRRQAPGHGPLQFSLSPWSGVPKEDIVLQLWTWQCQGREKCTVKVQGKLSGPQPHLAGPCTVLTTMPPATAPQVGFTPTSPGCGRGPKCPIGLVGEAGQLQLQLELGCQSTTALSPRPCIQLATLAE